MNYIERYISVTIIIFLFGVGCAPFKHTERFEPFQRITGKTYIQLDGVYENKAIDSKSGCLRKALILTTDEGYNCDGNAFVQLKTLDQDKIKFKLLNEKGVMVEEFILNGRIKDGYFVLNRLHNFEGIPIILYSYRTDDARIGLDLKKNLIVDYVMEYSSIFLFLGGGAGTFPDSNTYLRKKDR